MESTTYSLYLDADLNRVYTGALSEVAATELRTVSDALGLAVTDVEPLSEGRSRMLRFDSTAPADRLAAVIGQLSASAALFAHHPSSADDGPLLQPLPIEERLMFGSDLVTTQRYRGKTNERLTRAMLNVALATAGIDPTEAKGTVLDPMCGRGTTLNWALAYGLDGLGIEADLASLDHHAAFLETWAKRQRLPHKMQRFRPKNGEQRNATFDIAPDRASFKAGDGPHIETFRADAGDSTLAIKRSSIDVVLCDLPYGVQHRGSTEAASDQDTLELVERLLPTWARWLKPTGAVCLAWNTKRAGRRDLSEVMAKAGFFPVTTGGGVTMRHRVDATIDRDVLVASARPRRP